MKAPRKKQKVILFTQSIKHPTALVLTSFYVEEKNEFKFQQEAL